jgi:hypothetical protein
MARRSDFRPALEWTEEVARVWWSWGSVSAAPFPGVQRTWECFVAQFMCLDVEDVLENGLTLEVTAIVTDVARVVRTVGHVVYWLTRGPLDSVRPAPRPVARTIRRPEARALRGAGAILAPPVRRFGAGQAVLIT